MTNGSLIDQVRKLEALWSELLEALTDSAIHSEVAQNLARAAAYLTGIGVGVTASGGNPAVLVPLLNKYLGESARVLAEEGTRCANRYSEGDGGDLRVVELIRAIGKCHEEVASSRAEQIERAPIDVRPNIDAVGDKVGDISAYPLLVSNLRTSAPASSSRGAGGSTQALIDAAMRQTLGRLPRKIDPKTFLSALEQSFEIKEIEGRTEVKWRERVYAGRAELGGGVTGFQASLYSRARDAYDKFSPLIRDFHPLQTGADQENMDAARAILVQQFSAIVDELGTEGGPRPAKVDEAFETLNATFDRLGKVAGMKLGNVNTVEEDAALSDFRLAGDYLRTTRAAWNDFKVESASDLGTCLFRLSNTFQVIAESVDEVEASMDSVLIGPAERSVAAFVMDDDPKKKMRVSELLSWIRTFASDEAPRLVRDGGRVGAGALIGTLGRLIALTQDLVSAAEEPGKTKSETPAAVPADTSGLPIGMKHARVVGALKEVVSYLDSALVLAKRIAPSA